MVEVGSVRKHDVGGDIQVRSQCVTMPHIHTALSPEPASSRQIRIRHRKAEGTAKGRSLEAELKLNPVVHEERGRKEYSW